MFDFFRRLFGGKKEEERQPQRVQQPQPRPVQQQSNFDLMQGRGAGVLRPDAMNRQAEQIRAKQANPLEQVNKTFDEISKARAMPKQEAWQRPQQEQVKQPVPALPVTVPSQPKPVERPIDKILTQRQQNQAIHSQKVRQNMPVGVLTEQGRHEYLKKRDPVYAISNTGIRQNRLHEIVPTPNNPEQQTKMLDLPIKGGQYGGRTIADLRNQFGKSQGMDQVNLRRGIETELKGLNLDYSDEGELRRHQLGLALGEIQQGKQNRTIGSVANEVGKAMVVDPLVSTGEGLANLADVATGRRVEVNKKHQEDADKWMQASIKARNDGQGLLADWYADKGNESMRMADRAIKSQIEGADPIKAAGTVASAAAMPFAFAAQGVGAGRAAVTGFAGKTSTVAKTSIGKLIENASPKVAGELAKRTTGQILNSTPTELVKRVAPNASAKLQSVAGESVANVLSGLPLSPAMTAQQLGSSGRLEDYLIETATGAAIDAAFPVTAYGVGRGVGAVAQHIQNTPRYQPGFIAGPLAGDFSKAQVEGRVFDGKDGLPRFEVSDENMRIKDPSGETLGELIDHPELFKNYPDLSGVKTSFNESPGQAGAYNPDLDTISLGDRNDLRTLIHETQHAIQTREGFTNGTTVVTGEQVQRVTSAIQKSDADIREIDSVLKKIKQATKGKTLVGDAKLKVDELKTLRNKIVKLRKKQAENAKNLYSEIKSVDEYKNNLGEAEARAVEARMNMPMSERYVDNENTLYHGTRQLYEEFSKDKLGSNTGAKSAHEGFFFTDNKTNANEYSKTNLFGGNWSEAAEQMSARILAEPSLKFDSPWGSSTFGFRSRLSAKDFESGVTKEGLYKKISNDFDNEVAESRKSIGRNAHPADKQQLNKKLDAVATEGKAKLMRMWEESLDDMMKNLNPEIKKVELDYKNPYVLREDKKFKAGEYTRVVAKDGKTFDSYTKAIKYAKKNGYDAVQIKDAKDPLPGNTTIVFDESQIRKATPRSTFYDSLDVPKEDLIVRQDKASMQSMAIDPTTKTVRIDSGVKIPIGAKVGDIGRTIRTEIDKIVGDDYALGDSGIYARVEGVTKNEVSNKQSKMPYPQFVKKGEISGNFAELLESMQNVRIEEMRPGKAGQASKIKRNVDYYIKGDVVVDIDGKFYRATMVNEVNKSGQVTAYDITRIAQTKKPTGYDRNRISGNPLDQSVVSNNIARGGQNVKHPDGGINSYRRPAVSLEEVTTPDLKAEGIVLTKKEFNNALDEVIAIRHPELHEKAMLLEEELRTVADRDQMGLAGGSIRPQDAQHLFGDNYAEWIPRNFLRKDALPLDVQAKERGFSDPEEYVDHLTRPLAIRKDLADIKARTAELWNNKDIRSEAKELAEIRAFEAAEARGQIKREPAIVKTPEQERYEAGQAEAKAYFEQLQANPELQKQRKLAEQMRKVDEAIERGFELGPRKTLNEIIDTTAELGFVPRAKVAAMVQEFAKKNGYEIGGGRPFKKDTSNMSGMVDADGNLLPTDSIKPSAEMLKQIKKPGVENAIPYGQYGDKESVSVALTKSLKFASIES